jgi:hypothetical protein
MNNDKFYEKLKQKVELIKTEHFQMQSDKKYDYFNIKNIVNENIKDMYKNKNKILLKNEKYENYLKCEDNNDNNIDDENDFELDTNSIIQEKIVDPKIEEINNLEKLAINKAKELGKCIYSHYRSLENQINNINQKRVELILKEFRSKLDEDKTEEYENFKKTVELEYKSTTGKILTEHQSKLNSINSLQNKIDEIITYCEAISNSLKDDRINLNSHKEKYLATLELEKNNCLDKYKFDSINYVENRVNAFKNYLNNQLKK